MRPPPATAPETSDTANVTGVTVADIKTLVTQRSSGQSLMLQGSDFQAPSLDVPSIAQLLSNYFGSSALTLSGVTPTVDTDQCYAVRGQLRNAFLGAAPDSLTATLTFRCAQGTCELAIDFSGFQQDWLGTGFAAVSGTVLTAFALGAPTIAVDSSAPVAPGEIDLSVESSLALSTLPDWLQWILGSSATLQVTGTITGTQSDPVVSLSTETTQGLIVFGEAFPVRLTFAGAPPSDAGQPYAGSYAIVSQVSCTLDGQPQTIELSATATGLAPLLLTLSADLEPALAITLAHVGALLGIDTDAALPAKLSAASIALASIGATLLAAQKSVQSPYLTVTITDPWQPAETWLVFTGMRLTFMPSFSTYATVAVAEVDGTVFGQPVVARVFFPSQRYSVGLAADSTFDVVQLLKTHGIAIPGLKDTTCTMFELQGSIQDQSYSFVCALAEVDLPIGSQVLPLSSVRLCLSKDGGGIAAQLEATTTIGNAAFQLAAQYAGAGGWSVAGAMQDDDLDLADFADGMGKLLGIDTTFLRELKTGANARMQFNTQSNAFSVSIDVEVDQLTSIVPDYPFASGTMNVSAQLATSVDSTQQRTSQVSFQSTVEIGSGQFLLDITFDTSALTTASDTSVSMSGEWIGLNGQTIGPKDLAATFGLGDVEGLSGIDLALTAVSFTYAEHTFTALAQSKSFGSAFITVGNDDNQQLSYVFGLNCAGIKKLSCIPGLGAQLTRANFIAFKSVAILASTGRYKTYQVPQVQPGATTTLDISPGVSLAMVVDFDTFAASTKALSHLGSFMTTDELTLQVELSSASVQIFAALDGSVSIPAGKGHTLALTSPRLDLTIADELIVQLSGGISITYQHTVIEATAAIILDESQANVTLNVTSNNSLLPAPDNLRGVALTEFGLAMGIFFEPPGLDFGLEGTIQIAGQSRLDTFAVLLEIVVAGGVPAPDLLYLSFYIDEIDLLQFLGVFTTVPDSTALAPFADIKATNLSLYFCDEPVVVLPDGTTAQAGLGFSADIDLYGFGFGGAFQSNLTQGISGSVQCAPVNLMGALRITGGGQELARVYQEVNARWVPLRNNAVVPPIAPRRKEILIPRGGPVFKVSTVPLDLHVDMVVTLFDVVGESISAVVTPKGMTFTLTFDVAPIAVFTLTCTLRNWSSFSATGKSSTSIEAEIPIPLYGTISLSASVAFTLGVVISPTAFALNIDAHFEYDRTLLHVPRLTLSAPPSSLAELPAIIIQGIIDNAWDIFKEIFWGPEAWAAAASKGVFRDNPDIAEGLRFRFNVSACAAATIMLNVGMANHDAAAGLKSAYGLQSRDLILALKGAGQDVTQVRQALNGLSDRYPLTAAEMTEQLQSVYGQDGNTTRQIRT